MQRIYIFGSSGSGKSTLGKKLSELMGIEHTELDAIHHQANWQPLEVSEFRNRVDELTNRSSWIIDGGYSAVRDLVLNRADTIIFLDYRRPRILYQLIKRTIPRMLFKTELWNGNYEHWRNFLSLNPEKNVWIWSMQNYTKRRQQMDEIADNQNLPAVTCLRFRTPGETEAWLNSLAESHSR